MSFRENLKSELSFQGILVKELSAKTGINKRTLDNYLREHGNIPSADVAVKIAEALGVTVEFLVTGRERKTAARPEELYPADIRMLAKRLLSMNENEKSLITALVAELERQHGNENYFLSY